MNKVMLMGTGAVLLLLLLLVFSTTYTVSFHEVAVRSTFGQADEDDIIVEPGLQWKLPIFQDKSKFDKRLQVLELRPNEISLVDGQQVVVKAFLLWRVDDSGEGPLRFDKSYRSIDDAAKSLVDPFVTALAGSLSTFSFEELLGVNSQLGDVEQAILGELSGLPEKGIVPVSVGISQFLLPERTTNAVIKRMQQTRTSLAEARRSAGTADATGIRADAKTDADVILAFANLRAEDIRSKAEATAAEYLTTMSEAEELAIFLEWIETYKAVLSNNTTFFVTPERAPFHLADINARTNPQGIPLPSGLAVDDLASTVTEDAASVPTTAGAGDAFIGGGQE